MINIILKRLAIAVSYFLFAFSGVAQANHGSLLYEPPNQPPIQLFDQQPYAGYSGPAYEEPMQRAYEVQLQQQRQLDILENQIRREQQGRRSYAGESLLQEGRRSYAGESLLAPRYFRDTR